MLADSRYIKSIVHVICHLAIRFYGTYDVWLHVLAFNSCCYVNYLAFVQALGGYFVLLTEFLVSDPIAEQWHNLLHDQYGFMVRLTHVT